jgi:small GTP-binding protein
LRRNAFPEKPLARNGTCHFGTRPSLVGYRDPVMSQTPSTSIRTVALVGHGAAGKTTLAESLLAASGAITSRGSVEKGNTICDFDPQEKEFGHSLQTAVASVQWGGAQIHLIDTPGYPDFAGQAIAALAGVDTALIVVNAQTGIELSTERMFALAGERGCAACWWSTRSMPTMSTCPPWWPTSANVLASSACCWTCRCAPRRCGRAAGA